MTYFNGFPPATVVHINQKRGRFSLVYPAGRACLSLASGRAVAYARGHLMNLIQRLGQNVLATLSQFGGVLLLFLDVVRTIFTRRPRVAETFDQLYKVGWQSQAVVLITGAFTGMVFAVQTGLQFHKVKMDTAVGPVVAVAMLRELAPVLTALMVSGRVGAAFAAELGTMKVTEQLDALRAMGTSPVDYLAAPRFVALVIGLPLLTAEAMACGIFAGFYVAVHMLNIDSAYYWYNMLKFTAATDVMAGLIKSVFFAVFIALIACHRGFNADEGAEGVGRATTEAVVVSSLTVLITNFFIAVIFNAIVPI